MLAAVLLGKLMRTRNRLRKSRPRKTALRATGDDSPTFTLASTIRAARMIVVAPLATAAYQVPTLISAGSYAVALKCAFFSALSFLILAISTSLADLLTRLLEAPIYPDDGRNLPN